MTRGKPKAGGQARVPGVRRDRLSEDEVLVARRALLKRLLDDARMRGQAVAGIVPERMDADALLAEIHRMTGHNDGRAGR